MWFVVWTWWHVGTAAARGAHCLVSTAALVFLALLVLWGSLSLWFPVSHWGFLYTHPETYQQLFSRFPWCFLFALLQNKRMWPIFWWRWTYACSERGACSFNLPRPSSLWAEETLFLPVYTFFRGLFSSPTLFAATGQQPTCSWFPFSAEQWNFFPFLSL